MSTSTLAADQLLRLNHCLLIKRLKPSDVFSNRAFNAAGNSSRCLGGQFSFHALHDVKGLDDRQCRLAFVFFQNCRIF